MSSEAYLQKYNVPPPPASGVAARLTRLASQASSMPVGGIAPGGGVRLSMALSGAQSQAMAEQGDAEAASKLTELNAKLMSDQIALRRDVFGRQAAQANKQTWFGTLLDTYSTVDAISKFGQNLAMAGQRVTTDEKTGKMKVENLGGFWGTVSSVGRKIEWLGNLTPGTKASLAATRQQRKMLIEHNNRIIDLQNEIKKLSDESAVQLTGAISTIDGAIQQIKDAKAPALMFDAGGYLSSWYDRVTDLFSAMLERLKNLDPGGPGGQNGGE